MKTEIRTRFEAPGVDTIYEAEIVNGQRRIRRDNLGLIEAVKGGWKVTIACESFINADRKMALAEAERDIRLIQMLKERTDG